MSRHALHPSCTQPRLPLPPLIARMAGPASTLGSAPTIRVKRCAVRACCHACLLAHPLRFAPQCECREIASLQAAGHACMRARNECRAHLACVSLLLSPLAPFPLVRRRTAASSARPPFAPCSRSCSPSCLAPTSGVCPRHAPLYPDPMSVSITIIPFARITCDERKHRATLCARQSTALP